MQTFDIPFLSKLVIVDFSLITITKNHKSKKSQNSLITVTSRRKSEKSHSTFELCHLAKLYKVTFDYSGYSNLIWNFIDSKMNYRES